MAYSLAECSTRLSGFSFTKGSVAQNKSEIRKVRTQAILDFRSRERTWRYRPAAITASRWLFACAFSDFFWSRLPLTASRANRSARSFAVSRRVACSLILIFGERFHAVLFPLKQAFGALLCAVEAMSDNALLFSRVVRKSHYKAASFPKLHVIAIHKLRRLLDGFLIAGIFDGFHWARNMVGAVEQIDAI